MKNVDASISKNKILKRFQKASFEGSRATLNKKTFKALKEYDSMIKNDEKYPRYNSFEEVLKEIGIE